MTPKKGALMESPLAADNYGTLIPAHISIGPRTSKKHTEKVIRGLSVSYLYRLTGRLLRFNVLLSFTRV